jgi:hypothetical protein
MVMGGARCSRYRSFLKPSSEAALRNQFLTGSIRLTRSRGLLRRRIIGARMSPSGLGRVKTRWKAIEHRNFKRWGGGFLVSRV